MKTILHSGMIVLLATLTTVGCARHKKPKEVVRTTEPKEEAQTTQPKAETPTTPTAGVQKSPVAVKDAEDIANNPTQYAGETVTIRGQIDRVIGPRAFTVDVDGVVGGDEILVVSRTPGFQAIKGHIVEVTGDVHAFTIGEIETEINADLEDETFAEFQDKAVIVAGSQNDIRSVMD